MTSLHPLFLRRQAERLLSSWDSPTSAGATLGLVRDGALVLHLSAGMASLEHRVPIGTETRFRIASVSKQFTCAAILMLAEAGLLSPGDDLRDHLPEMPEVGARITLEHLMHNSSGLRDMLEAMRMGGADLALACGPEALLDAVQRQSSLNFAPGTRFLYSNTGFMLLGRIVERLAGEPLGRFLERRIFAPLGMTRTVHTPTTTTVVPGLAQGYLPRPDGFVQARHGFPLGGEGGLVSCVEDLALWERALTSGTGIGRVVAEGLSHQQPFTNGRMNPYARGLELGVYRGLRTVEHGGLWPGYRTCFLRAPDRALAVIAIANHGGIDPRRLAYRLLDAAVDEMPGVHPLPPLPSDQAIAPLLGRWIAPRTAETVEFSCDADGRPMATQHGVPFPLVPTEDGRLTADRGAFAFTLALPAPGSDSLLVETSAGEATLFEPAPEAAELSHALAGTAWRCEELGAEWRFIAAEDGLAVRLRGPAAVAGPWPVHAIAPDALRVETPGTLVQGWLDLRLLRDAAGLVDGFAVSGARARDLIFRRVAQAPA